MAGKKWTGDRPDKKMWSTEEDSIMETHYKSITVDQISLMLPGRSISSIRNRARTKGITRAYINYSLTMSENDAYYLGWIASD